MLFLLLVSVSTWRLPSTRVVAIGDVHGDLSAMTRTLAAAGIIDERHEWIGGNATLVQLGDVLDRGNRERECWTLLQRLKATAPASGGAVVLLCGNHEVMNALGAAGPYVHASGYAAFGPDRFAAWAPGGELATQLADCPVVAVVGDSVFVHASLPADASHESIERLNAETREWLLGRRPKPPAALLGGRQSPIWDRSLSMPSDEEPSLPACAALHAALRRLGAARVVVGHTPQRQVNCACDGAVWRCDTGMSRWVMGGKCEALEISNGVVRVLGRESEAVLAKRHNKGELPVN
ncbi:hypothetical protein AB1Y20_017960 [Prymnesium parvum]|uniref:Calcineurin-like phosphoesterase domain-containing protein n=1 Tax=Prymnesium parvum TaxID=97485 RepID=A0AB34JQG5_PRYPA